MPRKRPVTKPIVIEGVVEFINTQEFYKNRAWVYDPLTGESVTFVDGEKMTSEEFLKAYPIRYPANFYHNQKKNPDKTKEFIYT